MALLPLIPQLLLGRAETPLPYLWEQPLCPSTFPRPGVPFQLAGSTAALGAFLQSSRWGAIPQDTQPGGALQDQLGWGPGSVQGVREDHRQSAGKHCLAWGFSSFRMNGFCGAA